MIQVMPDYQDSPHGPQLNWEVSGKTYNNAVFLHGDLEDEAGFDIVYNVPNVPKEYPAFKLEGESGEIEVQVHTDVAGYRIAKAVLIWWIAGGDWFKGLICRPDDLSALEYARKKQKELAKII